MDKKIPSMWGIWGMIFSGKAQLIAYFLLNSDAMWFFKIDVTIIEKMYELYSDFLKRYWYCMIYLMTNKIDPVHAVKSIQC